MTKEPTRYYAISNPDSEPSMIAVLSSGYGMRQRLLTAICEHYDLTEIAPVAWFDEARVIRYGHDQTTVRVFEDDEHSYTMDLTVEQTWLY